MKHGQVRDEETQGISESEIREQGKASWEGKLYMKKEE